MNFRLEVPTIQAASRSSHVLCRVLSRPLALPCPEGLDCSHKLRFSAAWLVRMLRKEKLPHHDPRRATTCTRRRLHSAENQGRTWAGSCLAKPQRAMIIRHLLRRHRDKYD